MKTIGIAANHAGYELKEYVKFVLMEKGYGIKDFGTFDNNGCDYADFAHPLSNSVEKDENIELGIAVCGSGNGINMTLNKHQHIRAALCWHETLAVLAKAHNNANILVLPARFISKEESKKCINAFLNTKFEGGRHLQRIRKIPLTSCKNNQSKIN